MKTGVPQLRAHAVAHSLFRPTTLPSAIARLGFVQADPIRSPARAQDLILRHRVAGHRAGDLERRYAALDIEEEYLYAYGFVSRAVWRLLHPRGAFRPSALERGILEAVGELGPVHPAQLEARFGRKRVVNDWGGQSKATTRALDRLHHRGLLRVARRDGGIRIYQVPPPAPAAAPPRERLQGLVLAVAEILAPVDERTLLAILARLRRRIPDAPAPRALVRQMRDTGELELQEVDRQIYLWPAGTRSPGEPPRVVRFLAPFDPVVWDRRRFEHLWGWPYRFEAYTPAARRVRGYYAMPLLWGDRVIGWANARVEGGELAVELGFVGERPRDRAFTREADAEIARLDAFLSIRAGREG